MPKKPQIISKAKSATISEISAFPKRKIGYKFFYNGNELVNQDQTIIEIMSQFQPVFLQNLNNSRSLIFHTMPKEYFYSKYLIKKKARKRS